MTLRRRYEMMRVLWGFVQWDLLIAWFLFNPEKLEVRYEEEIAFWEKMNRRWQ